MVMILLSTVGSIQLSGADFLRIGGIVLATTIYLSAFYLIGLLISTSTACVSLIILGLFSSGISQSNSRSEGHNVNPTGHLTVDTEFGTINIETTDRNHVDIAIKEIWRSRPIIMRPKLVGWRDELFEDFETTIEYNPPDTESAVRVGGKFKRGREYWQEELKWFKVEIQVTVPHQYNVTLETVSHRDIHIDN